MVYECEKCETALAPGLMECPNCGEKFGEPVPDDAILPENEPVTTPELPPSLPPVWEWPEEKPLPENRKLKKKRRKRIFRPPTISWPKVAATLIVVLALSGLGWTGYRQEWFMPPSAPSVLPYSLRIQRTDLAAHPKYAPTMAGFVHQLRVMGVGAQWPAFGSDDVIVITPPLMADGKHMAWDTDFYHGLAQGIWRVFAQNRYQSGFSETDTTTCFVIVTDPSGRVVAVDLMGNLK